MSAAKRPKRIQPRKCHHCRRWFTPAPNNAHKQAFCCRKKCRDASHRMSQHKYQRLGHASLNTLRAYTRLTITDLPPSPKRLRRDMQEDPRPVPSEG